MLDLPDCVVDAVDSVDDVDDDCSRSKCWAKFDDVKSLAELYLESNHILLPTQIQGHALFFIDTVNNDLFHTNHILCLNVIGASPPGPLAKII
jgi:hypothetical protein